MVVTFFSRSYERKSEPVGRSLREHSRPFEAIREHLKRKKWSEYGPTKRGPMRHLNPRTRGSETATLARALVPHRGTLRATRQCQSAQTRRPSQTVGSHPWRLDTALAGPNARSGLGAPNSDRDPCPPGIDESYLACSMAHDAFRDVHDLLHCSAPQEFRDLRAAQVDGCLQHVRSRDAVEPYGQLS